MDRRSFGRIPGGFRIVGDSNVEFFLSNTAPGWCPAGSMGATARTLRSANGIRIEVSGCSHCVVSFLGLQVDFPVLVCDLATGTDAIIGIDVLGSVLPHTLDIKNGLLFTEGGGGGFSSTTPTTLCSIRSRVYGGSMFGPTVL